MIDKKISNRGQSMSTDNTWEHIWMDVNAQECTGAHGSDRVKWIMYGKGHREIPINARKSHWFRYSKLKLEWLNQSQLHSAGIVADVIFFCFCFYNRYCLTAKQYT